MLLASNLVAWGKMKSVKLVWFLVTALLVASTSYFFGNSSFNSLVLIDVMNLSYGLGKRYGAGVASDSGVLFPKVILLKDLLNLALLFVLAPLIISLLKLWTWNVSPLNALLRWLSLLYIPRSPLFSSLCITLPRRQSHLRYWWSYYYGVLYVLLSWKTP